MRRHRFVVAPPARTCGRPRVHAWAAALVLAALVPLRPAAAQLPGAKDLLALPSPKEDEPVDVQARTLVWSWAARRALLTGDVRLTLGDAVLQADEATLDLDNHVIQAEGDVHLVEGPRRLRAARLVWHLDRPEAEADDVLVRLMQGDRVRLSLRARRLERIGERVWKGRDLSFTPCDCGPGAAPAWSITAASGRVVPGEGALLWWPVLHIRNVPVLPLPVFYLPLAERRTGLLLPRVGWSGRSGFHVAEPLFVTLGRSWDLTLTPGWYSGRSPDAVTGGTRPGVKGFEQLLELRFFPLPRTRGSILLLHLYDQTLESGSPRGSRGTLAAHEASRFDAGGFGTAGEGAAADVFLASDAAVVSDLALRLERREVGYVRSAARVWATPDPLVDLEAGVLWLQDLRSPTYTNAAGEVRPRPLFGDDAPVTFQRLPEVHGETSLVPLGAGFSARGAFHGIAYLAPGLGTGVFTPGEQGPVLHGRLALDVGRGLHVGEWLAGRAEVGARADGWAQLEVPGLPGGTATRLYPLADVELHTGLTRAFGALVHRLVPRVRWRYVPVVQERGTRPTLDAWDVAVAPEGLDEVAVGVESLLSRRGRTLFGLSLDQGVDLRAGRASEIRLAATLALSGMGRLEGVLGWDWRSEALTFGTGQLRVNLPGGGAATASWYYVAPQASAWLRAGLDEIFAAGAVPPSFFLDTASGPVWIHEVAAGLSTPLFSGLSLRAGLTLDPQNLEARAPQPTLGLAYRSKCRCWGASVLAVWPPGQDAPEFVFGFELADLGGVTTAGM